MRMTLLYTMSINRPQMVSKPKGSPMLLVIMYLVDLWGAQKKFYNLTEKPMYKLIYMAFNFHNH